MVIAKAKSKVLAYINLTKELAYKTEKA